MKIGNRVKAGFKQIFLATGILLSKNAGFGQLLKKADIGFEQQKFCTLMMLRMDFVLFVLEFVCLPFLLNYYFPAWLLVQQLCSKH